MKTVTLLRGESSSQGTFGNLLVDDLRLYSLELPWLDDKPSVSCIPKSLYDCRYTLSPRLHKFTYEVFGDAKRAGIRIHSANLAKQLLGCIALGEKIGWIDGVKAILLSRPAISKFERAMQRQTFKLEIR